MGDIPISKVGGTGTDWLAGGGEMGSRMRAIDWSMTSLGSVDRWPQSLKTAVRIMLTSQQAMFVWWDLHGGSVHVDSPGEGKGSIFTIALPVTAVNRNHEREERVHPTASGEASFKSAPSLEGVNVLLVDDKGDTRELLSAILGQAGAIVKTAGSSMDALAIMGEWKPDVILSDIGMPGEDGYTFVRKVRSRPDWKGIPAAALTAYGRMEDRLKALGAGYQIHIPKPVEPAELLTVVASLVNRIEVAVDGDLDK